MCNPLLFDDLRKFDDGFHFLIEPISRFVDGSFRAKFGPQRSELVNDCRLIQFIAMSQSTKYVSLIKFQIRTPQVVMKVFLEVVNRIWRIDSSQCKCVTTTSETNVRAKQQFADVVAVVFHLFDRDEVSCRYTCLLYTSPSPRDRG